MSKRNVGQQGECAGLWKCLPCFYFRGMLFLNRLCRGRNHILWVPTQSVHSAHEVQCPWVAPMTSAMSPSSLAMASKSKILGITEFLNPTTHVSKTKLWPLQSFTKTFYTPMLECLSQYFLTHVPSRMHIPWWICIVNEGGWRGLSGNHLGQGIVLNHFRALSPSEVSFV